MTFGYEKIRIDQTKQTISEDKKLNSFKLVK